MSEIKFSRVWCMPNARTFEIKPIKNLIIKYLRSNWLTDGRVVDPFAGNSTFANYTNDLNPDFDTANNMDAVEYLQMLLDDGMEGKFDMALLDPPYSPRQMSEAYKSAGRKVSMTETQNARLYKECKDKMATLLKPGSVAITCGWNSGGFGIGRSFALKEILLVPCGAAHNDYIVTVEIKNNRGVEQ